MGNESKLMPHGLVSPPRPHYSIVKVEQMVGKTVKAVEVGERRRIPNVHQGEVIVIHFTDGTALEIDTGSNAANISNRVGTIRPEEFHTDFMLEWYP
jgi:hypothetical protein